MTMWTSTLAWDISGTRCLVLVRHVPALFLCVLFIAVSAPTHAQEVPEAIDSDLTALFTPVTPGTAFLRAVLIPGWGHASIGTYTRAGFYFALEATTTYGLLRTRTRLNEVRARAEFRENVLREELVAQGIVDFEEIESALETDSRLNNLRDLEESRRQQREDWAAFGIFLLLLSGADAYVSAHLQDFPAPINVQAVPAGGARVEVGVRIELGGD